MYSSVTIADRTGADVELHSTDARKLTQATGLLGTSAVRSSTRSRPTAHGGINETHWMDADLVVLDGLIKADTYETMMSEFRTTSKPLLETLDYGPALLKWREGDTGNLL